MEYRAPLVLKKITLVRKEDYDYFILTDNADREYQAYVTSIDGDTVNMKFYDGFDWIKLTYPMFKNCLLDMELKKSNVSLNEIIIKEI
jgi:hypothetical protein